MQKYSGYKIWPVILLLMLTGCRSSSDVVSGRMIQKRKYTAGWYIEWKKCFGTDSKASPETQSSDLSPVQEHEFEVESEAIRAENTTEADNSLAPIESDANSVYPLLPEKTAPVERSERLSKFRKTFVDESSQRFAKKSSKEYLQDARASYKRSWMYTILAMICYAAMILLFFNAYITLHQVFGGILLAVAIVLYVLMYLNLQDAAVNLVYYDESGGSATDPSASTLRFLVWAHIIISSFFCLILFFVPLIPSIVKVKKARTKYQDL